MQTQLRTIHNESKGKTASKVNVSNTTLLRRDSYLSYIKAGVKADTMNALRSAPLELETLFPDSIIKQAGGYF